MPELPDLEYLVSRLREDLSGAAITGVRVREPVVLRVALPGNPGEILAGRRLVEVERRGHFVVFTFEPLLWLVANLMLAGRFRVAASGERDEGALCVAIGLGGRDLRYLDDVKMGKLYLVPANAAHLVPGLADLGVDPTSGEFTAERFRSLAAGRRDQVRRFLMDKRAIASIGNAYADEILFAARIHPKTLVRALGGAELDRLHGAVVSVLREACAEVRRRGAGIDEKVRDFLKVRNRRREKCPRCGDTIRVVGVDGMDAFFCPTCQPATRRSFVDFRQVAGRAPAEPAAGRRPSGGSRARTRRR